MKMLNIFYTCKEKFKDEYAKDNFFFFKVSEYCHYASEYGGAADSKCNLRYSVPKLISIVSYKRSNHHYHFIIKELAQEFK